MNPGEKEKGKRKEVEGRGRGRASAAGSLPKQPSQPRVGQAESRSFIWISHIESKGPSTWDIFVGALDQKWEKLRFKPVPP